jgi:hypothetical protein
MLAQNSHEFYLVLFYFLFVPSGCKICLTGSGSKVEAKVESNLLEQHKSNMVYIPN